MKDRLLKLYVTLRMLKQDHGQDLIEYALVAVLIALAATAGMNSLAVGINSAFSAIGSKVVSYTG